jgi:hypothetical protein
VTLTIVEAIDEGVPDGKVVSRMTMSLDGLIADSHEGVAELFDWYEESAVTVPSANENVALLVEKPAPRWCGAFLRTRAPWCAAGACSTCQRLG